MRTPCIMALIAMLAGAQAGAAQDPLFDAPETLGPTTGIFAVLPEIAGRHETIPLREFPRDSFTPAQLSDLHAHGLRTADELLEADPDVLGQILEIGTLRAREFQIRLGDVLVTGD